MKPHMNRDVFHTKEALLKRPVKICERLSVPSLVHSVDMNDAMRGFACRIIHHFDVCNPSIIQFIQHQMPYIRYSL